MFQESQIMHIQHLSFILPVFYNFIFLNMNQSQVNSPTIKDLLPQSSQQIHLLKKQLLRDAYEQHRVEREPKARANPETRQEKVSSENIGSIRSSRSVQLLPTYRAEQDYSIRNMLKDSYDHDIRQRQRARQEQRQLLRNQRDSLNQLYKPQVENPYYDRIRKEQEDYAKVLDFQIKQKQLKKQMEKQRDRKQIQSLEIKRQQRNMGSLQKEQSFKQYFNKVSQYRDSVANDYLKYLNESPKKHCSKANDDREIMDQHRKLFQAQHKEEVRKNQERKQELRKVLEQQIMENRSFKASENKQYKNRGYVHSQANSYNPISNPIDYQLDINNKYVVKEIMQKQLESSRVHQ